MTTTARPTLHRLTPEQVLLKACRVLMTGDNATARRLLRVLLVMQPDDAGALHNLGVIAALQSSESERAGRLANWALAADPDLRTRFVAVGSHRLATPPVTPLRPAAEWNTNNRETFTWFEHAQKFLQVNRMDGVYAEFGCHEANTFRFALNTLGLYGRPNRIEHFYAFDSFEGMPEPEGIDRQKIWRRGMNHTSLRSFTEICRRDLHRITAVKGFFEDSLPAMRWNPHHVIVLAYIDVDYYSSTKQVLAFVKDKLRHGSIIAFDDWNCYYADPRRGQRLAHAEFVEEIAPVARLEPFLPISFGGMSFIYQEHDKIGCEVI